MLVTWWGTCYVIKRPCRSPACFLAPYSLQADIFEPSKHMSSRDQIFTWQSGHVTHMLLSNAMWLERTCDLQRELKIPVLPCIDCTVRSLLGTPARLLPMPCYEKELRVYNATSHVTIYTHRVFILPGAICHDLTRLSHPCVKFHGRDISYLSLFFLYLFQISRREILQQIRTLFVMRYFNLLLLRRSWTRLLHHIGSEAGAWGALWMV